MEGNVVPIAAAHSADTIYCCGFLGTVFEVWRGDPLCPGCGEDGIRLDELDDTAEFTPDAQRALDALRGGDAA